jgi:hypothetical protein
VTRWRNETADPSVWDPQPHRPIAAGQDWSG